MNLSRCSMKKIRELIVFTAFLVVALWKFDVVIEVLKSIWKIVFPFALGGAIAFVINVPMSFLEKKMLGKIKENNNSNKNNSNNQQTTNQVTNSKIETPKQEEKQPEITKTEPAKIDLSKYDRYENALNGGYKAYKKSDSEMNKLRELIESCIKEYGYTNVKIVQSSSIINNTQSFTANKTNVSNKVYDSEDFTIYYYAETEYHITSNGTESIFQNRSYIKVK